MEELIVRRTINANHQELVVGKTHYLRSYSTLVVRYRPTEGYVLDPKWNCSITTTKNVSKYVGLPSYEIRKRIESGQIKIEELN